MNRFSMSNAALRMTYKVSRKEIEKLIGQLDIRPNEDVELAGASEARVAAVQLRLRQYRSLGEYVADMNRYIADAANRRAQLVCFPAYTGILPVSFMPQFASACSALRKQQFGGHLDPIVILDYLAYFSDAMFDAYYHTMSLLAARHGVTVMAGSTLHFDEQHTLRHRALLFDRQGNLVGVQDKLSLSDLEHQLGIQPAGELNVFPTPLGPAAMLTTGDATYYEIARAAYGLGARALLHPAAFAREYTSVDSSLGLNMRVQENPLYGIQSVLVGDTGLGFSAEGFGGMFAPAQITQHKNGLITRSHSRYDPEVICAALDLDRLDQLIDPYHNDRNPDFLENYIDRMF